LARWCGAGTGGQQLEPVVEMRDELGETQAARPGCGQLNGQR
jgi:hypothetical protein